MPPRCTAAKRHAPRGKPGLSFIVALTTHDLHRLDFDAGEIDGSGRGSAHALRRPPRKISAIGSAQLGQDDHSTSVFVGRCDQRAFDVACTRGQDFSPFKPGASMPVDQPQPIRVVCVPDAEQFACLRFFRHQLHPSVVSVAKHEFECVNVTLKQPPQRQAARTN